MVSVALKKMALSVKASLEEPLVRKYYSQKGKVDFLKFSLS
jgi:hypothetical protein